MSDSLLHEEIINDDCPVCMEQKDNMITLQCNHCVCLDCCKEIITNTYKEDSDPETTLVKCPLCRNGIELGYKTANTKESNLLTHHFVTLRNQYAKQSNNDNVIIEELRENNTNQRILIYNQEETINLKDELIKKQEKEIESQTLWIETYVPEGLKESYEHYLVLKDEHEKLKDEHDVICNINDDLGDINARLEKELSEEKARNEILKQTNMSLMNKLIELGLLKSTISESDEEITITYEL